MPNGSPCTADAMCQSGICTSIGDQKRCTLQRKTGASCLFGSSDCGSGYCQVGSQCACLAVPRCELSFDCLGGCPPGEGCIQDPWFRCGVMLADGASCNRKYPSQCQSGYCFTVPSGPSYCAPQIPGTDSTDTRQCVDCCTAGVCY